MECALKKDRPDFVQLLIDNNFNFDDFLSIERQYDLYKHFRDKKDIKDAPFINYLEMKSEKLFIDMETRQETLESFKLKDCIKFLIEKEIKIKDFITLTLDDRYQFKNPTLGLFIWSVLFNRSEIAKIFLTKSTDQISLCLLASIIFKKFANHFRHQEANIFDENAKYCFFLLFFDLKII